MSDSPHVLSPGVLQMEHGWTNSALGAGVRENVLGGQFRFGVARNLEVRWAWDSFLQESHHGSHGDVSESGGGDNWLGAQYMFLAESASRPAMAFGYTAKVPTASHEKHLGSGKADHVFGYLVGKEIGGMTWDFNGLYRLIGREDASGFDDNGVFILTFARSLTGPVDIIGEVLAESSLNAHEKAFATTLWALSIRLNPRVVVDAGIEIGLTPHAPRRHVLVGITYAIGDFY
ncbi:MAG: transporter [Acidobacteria bacterium]|nr:transporter [Acidobacteriota bacterium]